MSTNYITDEVRALIGVQSKWEEACDPVQSSEVRRFFHATMDQHPRYWDAEWAAASRYEKPVAPPGFPVHAFRRRADDPLDTLELMADPDFDGVSRQMRAGLPKLPIPLSGVLNGGYEYEFYSYAKVGERIVCQSTFQREGKKGPMVFVVVEDNYATSDGRPLVKSVNVQIMR